MRADGPSDVELIDRALRGDAAAWEALVMRYRRLVYAVPLRLGLSSDQADDVFQETFAKLVEKLAEVRDGARVGLWLAVTARRHALARLTRGPARFDVPLAPGFERESAAETPLEELERLESEALVRRALETLPERCRSLLRALFYDDPPVPYARLARELGIPRDSLGPTRLRCFGRLRQALARIRRQ